MRSLTQKILKRTRRELVAKRVLRVEKEDDCLMWAIVGTGYMASIWADLLLTSQEGKLHSVCSRTQSKAESFGKKFGCGSVFCDLDAMLTSEAEELDFIYVATPLNTHYAIIKKCIEAGVNVLCEKPVTESTDEWSTLAQLARQNEVLLIEGMWMRCLPTFRQAEEWIERREIGPVRWIRADLNKLQLPFTEQPKHDTGVLMDYGVYALYFICHFLGGSPDWLESHVRTNQHDDDTDWSIVAGKQCVTAVVNISSNFHGPNGSTIIGEHGLIEWGSPFNRTNEISLHNFQTGGQKSKVFVYRNQGFEYQLAEVTKALRDGLQESALLTQNMTLETLGLVERVQSEAKKSGR